MQAHSVLGVRYQNTSHHFVPWDSPTLAATARSHRLSVPQLIFSWALGRLGTIVVATGDERHMKEALAVRAKALDAREMTQLDQLGATSRHKR